MMTGVFHFMANSFALILAGRKVGSQPNPVNQEPRRLLPCGSAICFVLTAFLGMSLDRSLAAESGDPRFAVLVFSKTTGFRHDSIPQGIDAIEALGAEYGFSVDSTEDAGRFNAAELARYRVVVFLCTTGEILDARQKAAFEGFIRAGGGFAGIHSAGDTEYQWAWYGRLVGAYFAS